MTDLEGWGPIVVTDLRWVQAGDRLLDGRPYCDPIPDQSEIGLLVKSISPVVRMRITVEFEDDPIPFEGGMLGLSFWPYTSRNEVFLFPCYARVADKNRLDHA